MKSSLLGSRISHIFLEVDDEIESLALDSIRVSPTVPFIAFFCRDKGNDFEQD